MTYTGKLFSHKDGSLYLCVSEPYKLRAWDKFYHIKVFVFIETGSPSVMKYTGKVFERFALSSIENDCTELKKN